MSIGVGLAARQEVWDIEISHPLRDTLSKPRDALHIETRHFGRRIGLRTAVLRRIPSHRRTCIALRLTSVHTGR